VRQDFDEKFLSKKSGRPPGASAFELTRRMLGYFMLGHFVLVYFARAAGIGAGGSGTTGSTLVPSATTAVRD